MYKYKYFGKVVAETDNDRYIEIEVDGDEISIGVDTPMNYESISLTQEEAVSFLEMLSEAVKALE